MADNPIYEFTTGDAINVSTDSAINDATNMVQSDNLKDIIFRNGTIAVLDYLNRSVSVVQHEPTGPKSYAVPFFYDFKNNKQFMKDMFIELPHGCVIPDHAEGNFDRKPKGVLLLDGFTIQREETTNRFVRATKSVVEYDENNNKVKRAYSGYMYVMPLRFSYVIKLYADTLLQAWQLVQETLMQIHKNAVLYFEFQGNRVPIQLYVGDDPAMTEPTKFEFGSDDEHMVTLRASAETYLPVYDETSLIFRARRIHEFYNNIYDGIHNADPIYAGIVDKNTVIRSTNVYVDPTRLSVNHESLNADAD